MATTRRIKRADVDVEIGGHYSSMGRVETVKVVVIHDGTPASVGFPSFMWGLPMQALLGPLRDGERVRVTAVRLSRTEGSRPRTVANPFRRGRK